MADGGKYGHLYTEKELRALLEALVEMGATEVPDDLTDLEIKAAEAGFDFHIGVEEPVFLLRAQDKESAVTLEDYRRNCVVGGSPTHHIRGISASIELFRRWQKKNETKVPSSDGLLPPAA